MCRLAAIVRIHGVFGDVADMHFVEAYHPSQQREHD